MNANKLYELINECENQHMFDTLITAHEMLLDVCMFNAKTDLARRWVDNELAVVDHMFQILPDQLKPYGSAREVYERVTAMTSFEYGNFILNLAGYHKYLTAVKAYTNDDLNISEYEKIEMETSEQCSNLPYEFKCSATPLWYVMNAK